MADVQTETPKFDPIAYQKQANEQEQAHRNGKPIVPPIAEKPKEPEKPKEAHQSENEEDRLPRRDRRTMNKLREEVGELRGRLQAYEELGITKAKSEAAPPSGEDAPKPQRAQYSTDAEYIEALGTWTTERAIDKRAQTEAELEEERHLSALYAKMEEKAIEDSKLFPDWDDAREEALEKGFQITGKETLKAINTSEVKAHLLYYLVKNPKELKALNDTPEGSFKIRTIGKLEAILEKMYSTEESKKEVVQASESEDSKERTTHPAEAQAGRNSAVRDSGKPRPSTEVAARGGSAPPGDIRIGSPEWHARENERERAMRGR